MIYSTTKTNSNLRKKVIEARVAGEHVRSWEQHTGWESSPYPLYRIYAETFEDSQATIWLNGSKNYKEVSEEEFDDAVGKTQALELWKSYKLSKNTPDKAALMLLTIKDISSFDVYIFGLVFILFSVIIVSYVLLMVYYMTLIFHSLRVKK